MSDKLKIALAFLLFASAAYGQNNIMKTAGVNYTAGVPTVVPNRLTSSEFAIDTTTGGLYEWHRIGASGGQWLRLGQGIDTIAGTSAPGYTPTRNMSRFAINEDDELYRYTGGAWVCINCSSGGGATDLTFSVGTSPVTLFSSTGDDVTFTAGASIGLTGTASNLTIINTAPDQTVVLTNGGGVVVTGTYPNFTLTATDQSTTNEIQRLDTFTIVSNFLRASLLNDGVPFSSVDLSAYLGNGTVTNFSAGDLSPLFTTTESTTTTTPALAFVASTAAQNAVLAGPVSGGAGAYSFRALAAADIPALLSGVVGQIPYFSTTTGITTEAGSGLNSHVWDAINNYEGIGTATPESRLHLVSTDGSGLTITLPGTTKFRFGPLHSSVSDWVANFINMKYNGSAWSQDDATKLGAFLKFDLRSIAGYAPHFALWKLPAGGTTDASLSPLFLVNLSSGHMGVGLAAGADPTARVDIKGSGGTSSTFSFKSSNSAGSTYLSVRDDGVTMINTTSALTGAATTPLQVNGGIFSNSFIASGVGDAYTISIRQNSANFFGAGIDGSTLIIGSILAYLGLNKSAIGSIVPANSLIFGGISPGSIIALTDYSNQPVLGVSVAGATSSTAIFNSGFYGWAGGVGSISNNSASNFVFYGPRGTGTGTAGDIRFALANVGASGTTGHTTTERFVIQGNTGYVGILNIAPSQALHVTGSIRATVGAYDSANSNGNTGDVMTSDGTNWIWAAPGSISGLNGIYGGDGALPATGTDVDLTLGNIRWNMASGAAIKHGMTIVAGASNTASRYLTFNGGADSVRFQRTGGHNYFQHLGSGNIQYSSANIMELLADSIKIIEGSVGNVVSMPWIHGESDGNIIKRMGGTETGQALIWKDATDQWEVANPMAGTYSLETGPTETMGGYVYTMDFDCNGGAIAVTVGSAMIEGVIYRSHVRRNNVNALTWTAEGGYAISWPGDATIPGDATVAVGAGGTGFQADYGTYILWRNGTVITIK
jgi:hypothetical protein